MKINGEQEMLARIARRGFLLVSLLAMTLICANRGRAQSTVATASTQQAKPAMALVVPVQTPPVIAKSEASQAKAPPEEKSSAKSQHEGISVHGHWIIDVKNPDGTRVSRQEFENALTMGGKSTLTGLLVGQYASGGLFVTLFPPGGTVQGPCSYTTPLGEVETDCSISGTFTGTSSATLCVAISNCFPTLSITPTPIGGTTTGFTLQGSATASQPGTISSVSTGVYGCYLTVTPQNCSTSGPGIFSLTATTLPSPVQILTAGQIIEATVQISFQ